MAGATVHPVDDRILVKRQNNNVSAGGIHMLEGQDQSALRGVIAAMGPGMPTMSGGRMPLTVAGSQGEPIHVKVGDGVIYSPEHAEEISIESGKFDLLHFRDLIAVLKVEPS